jgi:hypothetical protein
MFRQAIGGYFDWYAIAITIGMEVLFVTAALKIATTLVEREAFMTDGAGSAFSRLLRRWTRRGAESGRPVEG